jgi:hypothetical protein
MLLNPRLDRELSWISYTVPHARPAIYTNGDLLKLDILAGLIASGVKYVRVTRYPQIGRYNDRGGTALVPVTIPRLRADPCGMTSTSLSVDYRGFVKMCCNVIPDSTAEHGRYLVARAEHLA